MLSALDPISDFGRRERGRLTGADADAIGAATVACSGP
jgi:hypothetical protein